LDLFTSSWRPPESLEELSWQHASLAWVGAFERRPGTRGHLADALHDDGFDGPGDNGSDHTDLQRLAPPIVEKVIAKDIAEGCSKSAIGGC
jgi:hypothetical protein